MDGSGMSCVLLIRTDGRDELLAQTIQSTKAALWGSVTRYVLHTDAGEQHRQALIDNYPDWEVIGGERLGFGGAIDRAWRYVAWGTERWVLDCEDDFTFNRPVDQDAMARVLDAHPHIAQMALRRQPWNDDERRAGGVVELHPEAYTEVGWEGHRWLEHRLFWTTNVSLFRTSRCRLGWPAGDRSEGVYSAQVFKDPEAVCGYWGAFDSGEAVHHTGTQRAGVGY